MANNNNTKNLNVPTLRFPEFKGEWKLNILDSVCTFHNGRAYKQHELLSAGKYRVLRVGNFFTNDSWYYSDLELEEDKTASDGELLYAWSASFGPRFWKGEKVIYHYHIWKIDSFQEVCKEFLFYFLEKDAASIKNEVQGGTMAHITKADMERRNITYPTICEQSKIARLLFLLDHRIVTQNKIIEKYESLIKGIGNKLFSFKMRFKTNDGNDFPSWKTKSFENIGKTFSGLSGKAKEDFGIGKPYIQYKQVFDSPQIQIQNCGLVNVLDSENQNNVKYGDILFTVSSETPDEIGMSSVLLDEVDEMYLNSFCFGYRLSSFEVLNPLYASYFFRDSSFRNKIVKIAQGSTRYNISKSEFIKLKISLPCIEEQARIASFLSAVDEKLKEEKEILALYLIQKNHLLRQMVI